MTSFEHLNKKAFKYEYDSVQDMLYILFEPIAGLTFYEDVEAMPGVMIRYAADERPVGITIHALSKHLHEAPFTEHAIRQFAEQLVRQLEPTLAASD